MRLIRTRLERLEELAGIRREDERFLDDLDGDDAEFYRRIRWRQGVLDFEVFITTMERPELERLLDIHRTWLRAKVAAGELDPEVDEDLKAVLA